MGVIPEQKEYKNVSYENYLKFSADVQSKLRFTKVTHTPHSDRNQFDKHGFLANGRKVVVSYDIKANILSLTAQEDAMKKMLSLAKALSSVESKKEAVTGKPTAKRVQNEKQVDKKKEKQVAERSAKSAQKKKSDVKADKKARKQADPPKPERKGKAQDKKQESKPTKQPAGKKSVSDKAKTAKKQKQLTIAADGVLIRDCYSLAFTNALQAIRADEEVRINTLRAGNLGKDNETTRYTLIKNGKETQLEFYPAAGELRLSGEGAREFKQPFIEFGGMEEQVKQKATRANGSRYDKLLKTKMPTAYGYLSESERNDFGAGYDELSKAKDHYEYSMFLLSPFKGLENFIIDLQAKQAISVKMIGQAYDKDGKGNYILKECYRKKCGIVYSEVLVALYGEYYAKRNHYAHADGTGAHRIKNKAQAVAILDELFAIVEYNCKKLQEIGFNG